MQDLSENMGIMALNKRLQDPQLQQWFEGIFPKDTPANMRFSINFFTSIGLGGLTDAMREYLKNLPKMLAALPPPPPLPRAADSSSDDDSSDSDTDDSSESDSDSSSSDSSDDSSSDSSDDSSDSSSDEDSSSIGSDTDEETQAKVAATAKLVKAKAREADVVAQRATPRRKTDRDRDDGGRPRADERRPRPRLASQIGSVHGSIRAPQVVAGGTDPNDRWGA